MTDQPAQPDHGPEPPTNEPSDEATLGQLRELLIGPERARLDQLQERLDDPHTQARQLSDVLPDAITIRSTQDEKLSKALAPTIENAIKVSVRRDPKNLVDAIFPVMGPAIRAAIGDALRSMVQSLNKAVEHSLSIQGLKWRIRAWQTGRSFAEIVLLHTLLYRVEQVFLIHRETGLLLHHVAVGSTVSGDGDMVSGMLTAIQDFVRDSFSVNADERGLETMRVGDLNVWIEPGPHAMLAVAIRGEAPESLRTVFSETLEQIHLQHAEALNSFAGETDAFEATDPQLSACLLSAERETEKKAPVAAWVVLTLAVLGLGVWTFFGMRDAARWANCERMLRAEPGYVFVGRDKQDGKQVISGLRDPLARPPAEIYAAAGIDPERVRDDWQPYHALQDGFVLQRAAAVLRPPEEVTLTFSEGVLSAGGAASAAWAAHAEQVAPAIAGVERLDTSDLALLDSQAAILAHARQVLRPPASVQLGLEGGVLHLRGRAPHEWIAGARTAKARLHDIRGYDDRQVVDADLDRCRQLQTQLQETHIRFPRAGVELDADEAAAVTRAAGIMRQLMAAARGVGAGVRIEVRGHTDQTGTDEANALLSVQRAEHVVSLLTAEGLDAGLFSSVGLGATSPLRPELSDEDRALNRRVSFRVIISDEH